MTVTNQQRQDAAAVALSTLRKLGREDLIPFLVIEWEGSFTSRMGDALYVWKLDASSDAFSHMRTTASVRAYRIDALLKSRKYAKYTRHSDGLCVVRVRFSIPLWDRATEAERTETVVHEVCHLVAEHEARLAGRLGKIGHGSEWKRTMLRAGVAPRRCHKVDRTGLRRTRRTPDRVIAHCRCREMTVSAGQAGRIRNGRSTYVCRICRSEVVLGPRAS